MVPPPVTVRLKRIIKHYELRELNVGPGIDFHLADIDTAKYDIVETTVDIERIGQEKGKKKVLEGVRENRVYSPLTLTAEVARYIGKSCILVRDALEKSKEGMGAIVDIVNRYNDILYDTVIPELFKAFYTLDEKTRTEDIELRLVKPPKGGGDSDLIAEFQAKPNLLASRSDGAFARYRDKSFHLDNYCFDSKPELDFFKAALEDEDVEKLYFTGMLTSDKTECCVSYIDPESNTLRTYYPDFLARKKDGSYVIVEVKGENMIDDAVVKAKARSAAEMASASAMDYLMVPGGKAAFGLKPQKLPNMLFGRNPDAPRYAEAAEGEKSDASKG
jgi:hypothetical protein